MSSSIAGPVIRQIRAYKEKKDYLKNNLKNDKLISLISTLENLSAKLKVRVIIFRISRKPALF